jgi:hypothetical protein
MGSMQTASLLWLSCCCRRTKRMHGLGVASALYFPRACKNRHRPKHVIEVPIQDHVSFRSTVLAMNVKSSELKTSRSSVILLKCGRQFLLFWSASMSAEKYSVGSRSAQLYLIDIKGLHVRWLARDVILSYFSRTFWANGLKLQSSNMKYQWGDSPEVCDRNAVYITTLPRNQWTASLASKRRYVDEC